MIDGQLDLFLHSRAVVLANEIADCLIERNLPRAADCLVKLCAEAPEHPALAGSDMLSRVLATWPPSTPDPYATARIVRQLESHVVSAASIVFGSRATQFMQSLWRELADSVRDHPYIPEVPEAFCAALYLRSGDAATALLAASAIADAGHDPAVLYWRAVSSYRAQGLHACREPLFMLAWLAPQRLEASLAEIDDRQLRRDWRAFQTTCDWLDPADQASPAWFPAWYLVEHQAALAALDTIRAPPCRPAQTFAAISRLLHLESQGLCPAQIAARAELRRDDPEFFTLYMSRLSLLV